MWRKGSYEVEGYKNIGANYAQTLSDGTTINYEQNEVVEMTETVFDASDWKSQMTKNIKGEIVNKEGEAGDCAYQSKLMAKESGADPLDDRANGYETGTEQGTATNYTINATADALTSKNYLDFQIDQGNSALVGVDYAFGEGRNGGTTDHFVAISSRTTNLRTGQAISYGFFDPGTSSPAHGISGVFTVNNNNLLVGTGKIKNSPGYTVTHMRRNR